LSDSDLNQIYKIAPVESLLSSTNGGLSGYASTFHFLDYHNDIIAPGAYQGDIERFLRKGFIGGIGHNHDDPIGKPVELTETAKGLWLEAEFDGSDSAQYTRKKIADGLIKELSVGIIPLQAKQLRTRKEVEAYWKQVGWTPNEEELMRAENGARLIKRAKLLEISPVALAANEQSEIVSYKAGKRLSKASLGVIEQVCAQMKAAYELLEGLLVEAGVKADDEEDANGEEPAAQPVSDAQDELLSAFREFLASRS
jgi:HK97 family phage prohead protease